MTGPLWVPSPEQVALSHLAAFARAAASEGFEGGAGEGVDYDAVHAWSISRPEQFWRAV